MFNLVVLTGRLTHDPELKYTPNNVPVTSFSIAVERRHKQGEERQSDFINIVAWRSSAEFVSKYFQKGSMIGIEGAIQTRKYTDKEGKNRTAFEVVANNIQFVEPKRDRNDIQDNTEDLPSFIGNATQGEITEISDDDDLPF